MKRLLIPMILTFCCVAYSQSVWEELPAHPEGGGVTKIETSDEGDIFATTSSFNFPQVPGGVNRSTDGGNTWQNMFPVYVSRTIDIDDNGDIFASIWDWPNTNEGIYKSTDSGDTWNMVFDVGTNNNVFCIESGSSGYYAGTRTGVVFSADGNSWGYDAAFPSGNGWVRDIEMDENGTPIAATYGGVYYKELLNWVKVPGVNPADTITIIGIGGAGFLNSNFGEDEGLVLGAISGNIYSGTFLGVLLICWLGAEIADFILEEGINIAGVYSTTPNQGGTFEIPTGLPMNEGLPSNSPVSAFDDNESRATLKVIAGFFYNASDGAKIYTRDFKTSPVEDNNTEVPQKFSLEQNFPNPFNPVTSIKYHIPEMSFVSLKVFDVLGTEVATLVESEISAGTYEIEFDATGLSSGVYLYKLQTENFVESKKMMLLK